MTDSNQQDQENADQNAITASNLEKELRTRFEWTGARFKLGREGIPTDYNTALDAVVCEVVATVLRRHRRYGDVDPDLLARLLRVVERITEHGSCSGCCISHCA
jgi:hypothetical protein